LAIQTALPVMGNAAILAPPVFTLAISAERMPAWAAGLAAPPGWLGLLLAAAAAAWYLRQTLPGREFHVLGGLALGAGILAACARIPPDAASDANWVAYHTLLTAWSAAAIVLLSVGLAARNLRISPPATMIAPGAPAPLAATHLVEGWLGLIGGLTVALAVLQGFCDPQRPWWTVGAVLAVGGVAAVLAVWLHGTSYVVLAGLSINLAGIFVWWARAPGGPPAWPWTPEMLVSLVETNVLCLAVGSMAWSLAGRVAGRRLARDWSIFRREVRARESALAENMDLSPSQTREGPQLYGRQAAALGAVLLGLIVAAILVNQLGRLGRVAFEPVNWIALASIAAAMVLCLGDREARFALPSLYGLGLAAIGMGLWACDLSGRMLCWWAVAELAGFTLLMAVLGWAVPCTRGIWRLLGVAAAQDDPPAGANPASWFCRAQAILVALTAALAAWIAIDFAFDPCGEVLALFGLKSRLAAPPGVLTLVGTAMVMAAIHKGRTRAAWQNAAFALGMLLGCSIRWALIDSASPVPWLERSVGAISAGAILALVAGVGLRAVLPRGSDWIERAGKILPALAGLIAAMTLAVLGQEAWRFLQGQDIPLRLWEIAVVGGALTALAGACIASAALPAWDPFRSSDRRRQAYVYAAEGIVLLVGLHVKMTLPWIFHGVLQRYWMLVVVAVAFSGAALAELFHRRRLPVLAKPLERTALGLPILPAIAFWFLPAPDRPWSLVGRSPVAWFSIGAFYGFMAVSRRSLPATLLAILTTNLGLWVALDEFGVPFLAHPQLWLIPLALAGLVGEYVNRNRLTEAQSTAARYLLLSIIYVSSAADMYIAGIGSNWRLPLVLMAVSVAGALAGILFRIRSFLYLGFTFLVVDVLSILWYAVVQQQHTWILSASGVVLGAAIIALFAVFEKRRNDVLKAVERLKEWRQ
jgi:hypothetical protein